VRCAGLHGFAAVLQLGSERIRNPLAGGLDAYCGKPKRLRQGRLAPTAVVQTLEREMENAYRSPYGANVLLDCHIGAVEIGGGHRRVTKKAGKSK
jgi:hypothetical protein